LKPESRLSADLCLDSLLTMDLILALEDEFGVTFPDTMLAPENLSTVGAICTGLQKVLET
jgi:acyl carrier protein